MDTARLSSSQVDDAAAHWAARIDSGPLDAAQQVAFETWCAADLRHLGAYARARAILASMDRAQALGAGYAFEGHQGPPVSSAPIVAAEANVDAPVSSIASAQQVNPRRRWARTLAMAAGVAAIAIWLGPLLQSTPAVVTAKGEVRHLPLPDGSTMTLNTASSLRTRFDERERVIELEKGEVLFDVAKDSSRPFLVRAGDVTVRAVGTSFTVRRMPGAAVRVVVREGVVEVFGDDASAPLRAVHNQVAELPPRVGTTPRSWVQRPIETVQLERALAWREGLLSFEGVSLAEAAAEFERYSDIRIVVVEPELARKTITGLFAANNPRGFAQAAAVVLDARVSVRSNEIRVSKF